MMRYTVAAMLALLTMLAPFAVAQEETKPQEPADGGQAWVDDCPPDMMCAYSGGEGEPKNETTDEPTYGDCGGEVCAYDTPESRDNLSYGPDGCIECSTPPKDDTGSSCMDGAQENETCEDDVQYLGGGPTRGPADGSCEYCRGDVVEDDATAEPVSAPVDDAPKDERAAATNDVPAPAIALAILAVGALAILVIPNRK